MSLKEKAVSGIFWNSIDAVSRYGLSFAISIILARILSPSDYGIIGLTIIFIEVSRSFLDGGFSQALLRKKDCTQEDFSTVFYFNIISGIILYSILFSCSGLISEYFNKPILKDIVKVQGLNIILGSFTIIQQITLQRDLNFKTLAKINLFSTFAGGTIGIILATNGFGAWSLVFMGLINQIISTILLWLLNRWIPTGFYKKSFTELFMFGNKMLASRLLNVVFDNFSSVIITKFHSFVDFGFYTRADTLRKMPSQLFAGILQNVSLPVLANLQDDPIRLKSSYKNLIQTAMLLNLTVMTGIIITANQLILFLFGQKWLPSVPYLQILCISSLIYPLQSLNLNILSVKGRSDLHLKLEIIKKILLLPVFSLGIFWGIIPMVWGMVLFSIFAYFLNSYYSGKLINYPIWEQLFDIIPSMLIVGIASIPIYFMKNIEMMPGLVFFMQIFFFLTLIILISEAITLKEYIEVKNIFISKINYFRTK